MGSSLLASGKEAAKTLKDAIFGVEMRKGEDFLVVWKKEEDGHVSPWWIVRLSGEEEKEWVRECLEGKKLDLVMGFRRVEGEECEIDINTERVCILGFVTTNKESELGDRTVACSEEVVSGFWFFSGDTQNGNNKYMKLFIIL